MNVWYISLFSVLAILVIGLWTANRRLAKKQSGLNAQLKITEEREQSFKVLADSMPQVVWAASPKGQIEFYNQQWNSLAKEKSPLLPLLGLRQFIHPDDEAGFTAEWSRVLEVGEPFEHDVRIFEDVSQSYFWYLARANPLKDESGKILKWYGTLTNIDELKTVAAALLRAKEDLRSILDNMPDGVIVKDGDGKIRLANRQYLTLWQKTEQEIIGHEEVELWSDESLRPEIVADLEKVKATNRATRREKVILLPTGERSFLSTTFPILNGESGSVCVVNVDLTEEKAAAAKNLLLELSQKAAEETSRLKSEFLANMSHEIRTPINGILGMLSLLGPTPLSEKQRGFVSAIKKSSSVLLFLINDILDFSKIEAGKLSLEIVDFSLPDLLQDVHECFLPLFESKNLRFSVSTREEDHGFFSGDPSRIRQILNNVLSNALKFTLKGEVKLVVGITNPSTGGAKLHFSVIDSGIGIIEEHKSKLFKIFSQADASTARRFGGTGLGLAICKNLSLLMGGDIWASSVLGQGSTFEFTVEVGIAEPLDPNAPDQSELMSSLTAEERARYMVLVAEDNLINQEITKAMLEHAGYGSLVVANGQEALDMMGIAKVDVILMDCHMPEMDGYEATRILRSWGAKLPIIALTAKAFKEDREKCIASGMNEYLSKPINEEQLIQMVDSTVLRHKSTQPKTDDPSSSDPSAASNVPILDLAMLKRLEALDKDGSQKLINRLIQIYFDSNPARIAHLQQAIENEASDIGLRAHALKSSNANLGAQRVVMILEEIEHGQVKDLKGAFKQLVMESDLFNLELKRYEDSLTRA